MPLCSFFLPDILESATFHCRRHHHWRSSFSLNVSTMFHGPWIIITLKFRFGYTVSVTHSLNARRTDDMIERNSVNITLHDVDPTALRQLIDYTYTGEITITEDNVQVTNLIKYLPGLFSHDFVSLSHIIILSAKCEKSAVWLNGSYWKMKPKKGTPTLNSMWWSIYFHFHAFIFLPPPTLHSIFSVPTFLCYFHFLLLSPFIAFYGWTFSFCFCMAVLCFAGFVARIELTANSFGARSML